MTVNFKIGAPTGMTAVHQFKVKVNKSSTVMLKQNYVTQIP